MGNFGRTGVTAIFSITYNNKYIRRAVSINENRNCAFIQAI